jgi:hypothetical protein
LEVFIKERGEPEKKAHGTDVTMTSFVTPIAGNTIPPVPCVGDGGTPPAKIARTAIPTVKHQKRGPMTSRMIERTSACCDRRLIPDEIAGYVRDIP